MYIVCFSLKTICVSRNYIDIFYKSPINKSRSPYYYTPTLRILLFIVDNSQLYVISTSGWLTYKIKT